MAQMGRHLVGMYTTGVRQRIWGAQYFIKKCFFHYFCNAWRSMYWSCLDLCKYGFYHWLKNWGWGKAFCWSPPTPVAPPLVLLMFEDVFIALSFSWMVLPYSVYVAGHNRPTTGLLSFHVIPQLKQFPQRMNAFVAWLWNICIIIWHIWFSLL